MTYSEDGLVEQPAIALFDSLGWETEACWDEAFGSDAGGDLAFGRETRNDVVLTSRLREALLKLNKGIPSLILQEAVDEMCRDRSSMSDIAANEAIYLLLKDGYVYTSTSDDEGDFVVRYIDWETVDNNDFLLCSQMSISGEIETRRPDLLGFVNGLPLLFIELKTSHKNLFNAYKDNLKDYRNTIPRLFHYNQIIVLSNGIQSRVGSISSQWEHFAEWKKVESEKEPRRVSLEVVIRGVCERTRFLDIIENYILFVKKKQTLKIVAKYHQYLGVNQALEGLTNVKERSGQLGVFWHTQGSGKSFSMVFFCKKAFRKYTGNWTFVLITDRTDLDDQIYKTFHSSGALTENCQAESGAELKALLAEDHRFVFTLIQKFKGDEKGNYPLLSERDDIIVITDEAHRSQYDSLAMNMRSSMPNASYMAFTGTPLLSEQMSEEGSNESGKTQEIFGDYISIYNFADAVDDGATLPLYYENRVPEVNLSRDDVGDEIVDIIEQADLTDEQEEKLEREFSKSYHIITRDDRLETIAKDLVEHYINRAPFQGGQLGKAMVVSIDKATAIKMYDKVSVAWQVKLKSLKSQAKFAKGSRLSKLEFQIEHMESTDMAVVVSGEQNDEERLAKKGLDYKTHRERMIKEDIDEKFKDPDDNLRIVFVCAMWLTGFDAPSVSTLYLDKPLKNHTLMQTIARANRVFPGKSAGQVVDYINIFSALQIALGLYGGGQVAEPGAGYGVDSPARDKRELVAALAIAIGELKAFLSKQDVDIDAVISAPAEGFTKLKMLDDASEILLAPDLKDEFTAFVRQINRIFKAVLPDDDANEYVPHRIAINVIYSQMRQKSGVSIDDEDVLDVVRHQVNELLDESITTIQIKSNLPEPINIAGIDFDALAEMVTKIKKPQKSDAERLRNIIERKLQPMMLKNKSRQDLQQKFQDLIDEYNLGAYTAEEFFHRLSGFLHDLDHEEKRTVREGLSEEELAVFDLMTQELPLNEKERNEVKRIAKDLIDNMKELLVIDWRKKQRTKARVRSYIEDVLDRLPESYDDELWPKTCSEVYMHVYEKYPGQGQSVY
ncbi:type I restriction endonuclease subunit R [Vibrio parahaemolyticus]|uniref:type I restriction endonuclease subunit R n=1 Tax=Vibrio harveyi group TaxID=717610 RepID=UPI0003F7F2EE|nr:MULTISPECIES: type I restriction endonuclease subunit R [Vibrio harveyi group]EGR3414610.1 type I restriction endonuclease subunit R [Vibrio parahaemolyticus]EJE1250996.1 type I restriction endonuclease subunit R [Vibrio parahaemolyticus]EJE4185964.1 type I restriction endonuclease subunit R [Vibrio parahaemolyticus]EJG1728571.1 type I restriction endonuclease subunit R [Vibrio parahaemolyticus]EJG1865635.1 type I restriction endonuclease subunit R [Vibrio parahaemolyticus]